MWPMEALDAAIKSFKTAGGKLVTHDAPEGKLVCKCFGVTEEKIIKAIKDNSLKTVEEVTNFTKAGGACGKCRDDIQKLINAFYSVDCKPEAASKFSKMTLVQKIHAVEDVIKSEIQPRLNADGGSIELVDVSGELVKVRLLGMDATLQGRGILNSVWCSIVLGYRLIAARYRK